MGAISLIWAYLLPPNFRATLAPASFTHVEGNLHAAAIPPPGSAASLFFQLDHDSPAAAEVSRLVVHENGLRLGRAHSSHDEIASLGRGRFQHGDGVLKLSASDNSDPRANARTYTIDAPLSPRIRLLAAAILLLLVGGAGSMASVAPSFRELARRVGAIGATACIVVGAGLLLLFWTVAPNPLLWTAGVLLTLFGTASGSIAAGFTGEAISNRLFAGWRPTLADNSTALIFAAAGAVSGLALYSVMLLQGASPGLSLAGYFPVSDASGYWSCASQIIDDGASNSWCHRRPLYPLFLSGVSLLGGRDLLVVLFLQAGIVGACAFVFAREIVRWLGPMAAAFVTLAVGLYSWSFVLGQTMTEVLGLSLGLLSGSLLLRAAENRSLGLALGGIFLFAFGQMERPGAMFALPLLVLWAGMMRDRAPARFLVGAGLAVLAIALAVALNLGALLAIGGDPAVANANFPQTLYGLSIGQDWRSLVIDHPELAVETRENVRQMYALAFQNMAANPGTFVRSLASNLLAYLDYPWYREFVPISVIRVLLVTGGIVAAGVAARRSSRAALVFAVAIGELASSPFLAGDGNVRVWAVSAPLAHVGSAALLLVALARSALRHKSTSKPALDDDSARSSGLLLMVGGAGLLALCLASLTPLRLLGRTPERPMVASCEPGLRAVAVDTPASAWMMIGQGASLQRAPNQISKERLITNMSSNSWITPSLRKLDNVQVISGIAVEAGVGSLVTLFASPDLNIPRLRPATLCVDEASQIEIAGTAYKQVMEIAEPDPRN
jgi:hypothetical protein